MKIEKTEAWIVDGILYRSEEEALAYVEEVERRDSQYEQNLKEIQNIKGDLIPILVEYVTASMGINKFSFLTRDYDRVTEICQDHALESFSDFAKIKVITPGEFMAGFKTCKYEFQSAVYFGRFVKYAAKMNTLAGDIMSVEEFAEVLSRVEISPF